MIELLKTIIPIRQSNINKQVWISNTCPVCDYSSRNSTRILRYQIKLKIVKCYACGAAFRSIHEMRILIINARQYKENWKARMRAIDEVRMSDEWINSDLPF